VFRCAVYPSAELQTYPYGFFEYLRESAPVYKVPGRGETYIVSRHEDIRNVARHPEFFSSATGLFADFKTGAIAQAPDQPSSPPTTSFLGTDPPEHTRRRKRAIRSFTPGRLRGLAPGVQRVADCLIDGIIARGRCDLVEEFAMPLAALVICNVLGLPPADLDHLLYFSQSEGSGRVYLSLVEQRREEKRSAEMGAYIEGHLRDRLTRPREDGLADLIERQIEEEGHADIEDLVPDATILLSGGLTTTAYMVTSALRLLLENREEMIACRSDPAVIDRTLEEALRLEAPVQWTTRRVVKRSELHGVPLPEGALLLLAYGAGNRDAGKFECPNGFDSRRPSLKEHLAFGYGPHYCLGAPLARLEGRIAIERLLGRAADIRLAPADSKRQYVRSMTMRGLEHLYVEVAPVECKTL
jgi:cytochrome P450